MSLPNIKIRRGRQDLIAAKTSPSGLLEALRNRGFGSRGKGLVSWAIVWSNGCPSAQERPAQFRLVLSDCHHQPVYQGSRCLILQLEKEDIEPTTCQRVRTIP